MLERNPCQETALIAARDLSGNYFNRAALLHLPVINSTTHISPSIRLHKSVILNVVGEALSLGGGMTPSLQADLFPQLAREATGEVDND